MTAPSAPDIRIPLLLCLLCSAAAVPASGAGFGDPPDYHETIPADPEPGLEVEAWKALEQAVGSTGLVKEGALSWAARDLCRSVHAASGTSGFSLDPQIVGYVMLGRGVTDAIVKPFVMSGTSPSIVLESWMTHLGKETDMYAGRVVGLGADEIDGKWILSALAVHRLVDLGPVVRTLDVEGEIVISGSRAAGVGNLRVLVSSPSGEVWSPTIELEGSDFECVVDLGAGEGVYMVEVVGDIGYGPRVLNLFPVTVGDVGLVGKVVLSVPWREGPSRNAWMLFDLVQADRTDRGLAPLAPDLDLARVALAHSQDMRDAGFFGHVSPEHGGIVERTSHLGGLGKVAEVIALAPSPQRAFGNLLSSPAHSASLRDPGVTHMGVGKVKTDNGMLFTVVLGVREP